MTYCEECDLMIEDRKEAAKHMADVHNFCLRHGRGFESDAALKQHIRDSPGHAYCSVCDREFPHHAALETHEASLAHAPRVIECKYGCQKLFKNLAGLNMHLESNTCAITRQQLNAHLVASDTKGVVIDREAAKAAQAAQAAQADRHGDDSGDDSENEEDLTNVEVTFEVVTVSEESTYDAELKAYVCPLCQKPFSHIFALNSHLNGLAHERRALYRCWGDCPGYPDCKRNDCKGRKCRGHPCQKHFKALSALIQHAESKVCDIGEKTSVKQLISRILRQIAGGVADIPPDPKQVQKRDERKKQTKPREDRDPPTRDQTDVDCDQLRRPEGILVDLDNPDAEVKVW